MALVGKLVGQITIISDGDVFHDLFTNKPHHVSNITPSLVKGCDLHDGQWGKVGSIVIWSYVHDGKQRIAKDLIEAIDEENKSITFKVLEGDLAELYKTFKLSLHVDTKGENNLVTWTVDYEKLNENVEDPHTFLAFILKVTRDIESHHVHNS